MRRAVLDSLALALVGLIPLVVAWFAEPGERSLAGGIYLLFLGALVLLALTRATRAAHPARPSPFDLARRRPGHRVERAPELARVERAVVLGTASAFDFHSRLRPLLREIAHHRLATARGIDLDSQPVEARELLGDQTWQLVRPDRPPPTNRHAAGVSVAELHSVLESLARI